MEEYPFYLAKLKEELSPGEFLLKYAEKSRSGIRLAYVSLKFFHENILRQKVLKFRN